MTKFFVMGDANMLFLEALSRREGFGGFIKESSRTLNILHKPLSDFGPSISFTNFLRQARSERVTLVLSYEESSAFRYLARHFEKLSKQLNFDVMELYEFAVSHQVHLMYESADMHRDRVLAAESRWLSLSNRMTDDFSKGSIMAFLDSLRKKTTEGMSPFLIPFDFETFNKVSRHFSFVPTDNEIYIDVGAFDGDSVAKFIDVTPTGGFKEIHAFEPNPSNYVGLAAKREWIPGLNTYRMAVTDFDGEVTFLTEEGSQAARISEAGVEQRDTIVSKACKLDSEIEQATFIKIDVEGAECKVIRGARNLVSKCRPDLVVDTCHYADDPLEVYEAAMEVHGYKEVGMRFPHRSLFVHAMYFSDRHGLRA